MFVHKRVAAGKDIDISNNPLSITCLRIFSSNVLFNAPVGIKT